MRIAARILLVLSIVALSACASLGSALVQLPWADILAIALPFECQEDSPFCTVPVARLYETEYGQQIKAEEWHMPRLMALAIESDDVLRVDPGDKVDTYVGAFEHIYNPSRAPARAQEARVRVMAQLAAHEARREMIQRQAVATFGPSEDHVDIVAVIPKFELQNFSIRRR